MTGQNLSDYMGRRRNMRIRKSIGETAVGRLFLLKYIAVICTNQKCIYCAVIVLIKPLSDGNMYSQ